MMMPSWAPGAAAPLDKLHAGIHQPAPASLRRELAWAFSSAHCTHALLLAST